MRYYRCIKDMEDLKISPFLCVDDEVHMSPRWEEMNKEDWDILREEYLTTNISE